MRKEISLYNQRNAMEPMLPESSGELLAALSCDVLNKAGQLSRQLPSVLVRHRIAELVREMNSYYSNLIEGHKTLPGDIEEAMRRNFSKNPEKRANQHLNSAHIQVEKLMNERLQKEPELCIHGPEFLCWLHREFYSRLPEGMRFSEDRFGKKYKIDPGALRTFEVDVGQHQPPHFKALPDMLAHFAAFYKSDRILATTQLIALAAAHHRLAWIHPFGDGNGRVTRLYSHAWLIRSKVDAFGLWTLSRGLARKRAEYYECLRNADMGRRDDLDGRGNLSDRALGQFCVFTLKTMLDEIEFMAGLLEPHNLSKRIDHYLQFAALDLKAKAREHLSRLLKAALMEGEINRGKVGEIVGLRGTAGRKIIALALKEQLLSSSSEKGALSLVISSKTLDYYFPLLYQDLPTETTPNRISAA